MNNGICRWPWKFPSNKNENLWPHFKTNIASCTCGLVCIICCKSDITIVGPRSMLMCLMPIVDPWSMVIYFISNVTSAFCLGKYSDRSSESFYSWTVTSYMWICLLWMEGNGWEMFWSIVLRLGFLDKLITYISFRPGQTPSFISVPFLSAYGASICWVIYTYCHWICCKNNLMHKDVYVMILHILILWV